jgi:quinol monooxygenase YgiN
MIVVTGSIPVDGSQVAAITAAANAMRAATLLEDGCHEYRFAFAIDDADTVVVVEEWRDQDALNAHFASAHMAEFQAALATLVTGPPSVVKYEVSSKGPLR